MKLITSVHFFYFFFNNYNVNFTFIFSLLSHLAWKKKSLSCFILNLFYLASLWFSGWCGTENRKYFFQKFQSLWLWKQWNILEEILKRCSTTYLDAEKLTYHVLTKFFHPSSLSCPFSDFVSLTEGELFSCLWYCSLLLFIEGQNCFFLVISWFKC